MRELFKITAQPGEIWSIGLLRPRPHLPGGLFTEQQTSIRVRILGFQGPRISGVRVDTGDEVPIDLRMHDVYFIERLA